MAAAAVLPPTRAGLRFDRAAAAEMDRQLCIVHALDALVEAKGSRDLGLQLRVGQKIRGRKGLFQHGQGQGIEALQLVRPAHVVGSVGIRREGNLGKGFPHRLQRFVVPARLDFQLYAPVPLRDALFHGPQQGVDVADESYDRPRLDMGAGAAEGLGEGDAMDLCMKVPGRSFQTSLGHRVPAHGGEGAGELTRRPPVSLQGDRDEEGREHVPRRLRSFFGVVRRGKDAHPP